MKASQFKERKLTERLGLPAAAVPKRAKRAMAENFMFDLF